MVGRGGMLLLSAGLFACSTASEPEESALSRTTALVIIEQAQRIADANTLFAVETGNSTTSIPQLVQARYLERVPSPKEVLTWELLPDRTVVAKLTAQSAAICIMVNEIATGNALDTQGPISCQRLTVKLKAS